MTNAPRDDSTRARPPQRLRAVLFDLDGTLVTSTLDFPAIRRAIGVVDGSILEHIESLPPDEAARALAVVESHERASAEQAEDMAGARELLSELGRRRIAVAIVTNNARVTALAALDRARLQCDALICREDAPGKPAPDPLLLALERLGVPQEGALFVGDAEIDVVAGRRAGVWTIHIGPSCRGACDVHAPDLRAARDLLLRAS